MYGMLVVIAAAFAPWPVNSRDPCPGPLVDNGPFELRAGKPSQRPWLSQLTESKRFAALQAAREVSSFAARGERESFGAVVMGLGANALSAEVTDLVGPDGARISASEIRVRWADAVKLGGFVPDP